MEVEVDAVPSPARPTGAAGSVGPKPEGQLEEPSDSKLPQIELEDEISVKRDADPSTTRPCNTSIPNSEVPNFKDQVDKKGGIPKEPFSQDDNKTHKKYSSSSFEHPPQRPNLKKKSHKRDRESTKNEFHFTGCTNVIFGSVKNIYTTNNGTINNGTINGGIIRNGNFKEDEEQVTNDEMETKERQEAFRNLVSCQKELSSIDIVIVSENLTEIGLRYLSKKLQIDKSKMCEIENEHKLKGQTEVTYQTLAHWRSMSLTPMLHIVCAALLHRKVYICGGKEALESLQKHHFQNDSKAF